MMAQKMILHGFWRSGATWRLRIVLNLKGIPYTYRPVNLLAGDQKSPQHFELNPMRQVPVLEVEGSERGGGIKMTESMAVCEWVEEMYPDPPLLPSDPKERFQVRRLCEIINSNTQPIQNLQVLQKVQKLGGNQK